MWIIEKSAIPELKSPNNLLPILQQINKSAE
jgi:hypothetical protein